jgi:predicted Zn-dependent protease
MAIIWKLPEWLKAARGVENATQLRSLIREKTGQSFSLPTVSALYSGKISQMRISTIQTVVDGLGCPLSTFFEITPSEGALAAESSVDTAARRRGVEAFLGRKYASAARHLACHVNSHPADFLARLMLAESLLLTGRVRDALPHAETVAGGHPTNYLAQYLRGRSLLEAGEGGKAILALKQAVELGRHDPDDLRSATTALAQALSLTGRHDEALAILRGPLKSHPNSVAVNLTLLKIMSAAGSPPSKIEAHRRVLAARSPQAYLQLVAVEKNPALAAKIE